ncbi:MAG TPA: OadG family protein [Clostridia bacterium]|nr:OadG family protein [Clostridia bacterium]
MDFTNMSFSQGLLISGFSILIVFLVLVSISYLVDLTAFFVNRKKKVKEKAGGGTPQPEILEPVSDQRTVAIVMAALASMQSPDSAFVIRHIHRQKAPLSDWEAAALRESSRRPS